jgi:hypothetical protein
MFIPNAVIKITELAETDMMIPYNYKTRKLGYAQKFNLLCNGLFKMQPFYYNPNKSVLHEKQPIKVMK